MRGQRMVRERSEYSLNVLSTGSARVVLVKKKLQFFNRMSINYS